MRDLWKYNKKQIIGISLIVLMIFLMPVAVFHVKVYRDEQKIKYARKYDENGCIIWDDGRGPCWQSDVYDPEKVGEIMDVLEEDTVPFLLESVDFAKEEIAKALENPKEYFRDAFRR